MISDFDPKDETKYFRIFVDPTGLKEMRSSIIVNPIGPDVAVPFCDRATIKCSCGKEVAGVIQENRRAYVVVSEDCSIEKIVVNSSCGDTTLC